MDGDINMKFGRIIKSLLLSGIVMNSSLPFVVSANTFENASIEKQSEEWNQEYSSMTSARIGHQAVLHDNKVYVVGGKNASGTYLNTLEVFDLGTKTWTTKALMPAGIANFTAQVVGDTIYCIGGYDGYSVLRTVYAYNIANNSWSQKTDMPVGRTNLTSVVIGNNIYCIGGGTSGGSWETMYAYNVSSDSWEQKASMSISRECLSAEVVDGKIYVFGGIEILTVYDTVEMYDPSTNTWTAKANMPNHRMIFESVAINGYIYCIGGTDVSAGPLNVVDIYDVANNKWTTKTMPVALYDYSLIEKDGFIYIFGGTDASNVMVGSVIEYVTEHTVRGPFSSTSNIDVYIKPQSILSLSMDTNSVTFDEFDGVTSCEMPSAINLSIESSLPYNIYASLESEISNSDNTKTIDKSILGIKEGSMTNYENFLAIKQDILLKGGNLPGKTKHGIDIILRSDVPYEVDAYKTAIKIKVEQQ